MKKLLFFILILSLSFLTSGHAESLSKFELYSHEGLLYKINTENGETEFLVPEWGVFFPLASFNKGNLKDPEKLKTYQIAYDTVVKDRIWKNYTGRSTTAVLKAINKESSN